MLPTFLGIGVPRAGTTWLHELLTTHPEVYLPAQRKEIHFYNRYYDRGLRWYEGFFPATIENGHYRAIGEITPAYFYHPRCMERIAQTPSVSRVILMLRNPVERAYSYYGLKMRNTDYQGSFEDFLADQPGVLERGFYSRYFEDCFRYFDRSHVLVLITEQAVANVTGTKNTLAHFLDIAVENFPQDVGTKRVNQGYVTRSSASYARIVKAGRGLRKWDGLVDLAKNMGLKRFFGKGDSIPSMGLETRQRLGRMYADEIDQLEFLLQIDLACWKLANEVQLP